MKTKYVCRGFISLYVNFHNNRIMWSTNCKKIAGGGKRTLIGIACSICSNFFAFSQKFFRFFEKKEKIGLSPSSQSGC